MSRTHPMDPCLHTHWDPPEIRFEVRLESHKLGEEFKASDLPLSEPTEIGFGFADRADRPKTPSLVAPIRRMTGRRGRALQVKWADDVFPVR